MIFKKIILFYCFIVIFCFGVNAQSFEPSTPPRTELVDKTENTAARSVIYQYQSELTAENIKEYYKDVFSRQGLKLQGSGDSEQLVFNSSGKDRSVALIIISMPEEVKKMMGFSSTSSRGQGYKTYYSLAFSAVVRTEKEVKGFSDLVSNFTKNIVTPRAIDFMPLYANSKQLEYGEWPSSSSISIGYITSTPAKAVEDFYIKNMPSFGWELAQKNYHQGTYDVSECFTMLAPYSTFPAINTFGGMPSLKIRGVQLTFTSGIKRCVITIHTFDDALEKTRNTMYDLSLLGQYGNTIIGVIYFYD